MQLIGQPIKHVTFGKGVVTDWNGKVITVCFSAGEKKFIYPDAFSNFLILKNADAQKKVQHLLDVREEERETELKELQEQQEKKHMLENLKLSPQSQAVFHIDAEQHEAVFSSWTVSTGCYLSGYSKDEPRIPERLQPNSMCLLTERPKGCSETERRIVGAFMWRMISSAPAARTVSFRLIPPIGSSCRRNVSLSSGPMWPRSRENSVGAKRPSNRCPTAPVKRSSLIARKAP